MLMAVGTLLGYLKQNKGKKIALMVMKDNTEEKCYTPKISGYPPMDTVSVTVLPSTHAWE